MKKRSKQLSIRSKIWLADADENVVFGLGRLKMLEAIQRNGSIHSAAKDLGMSYRALWGRIKATEDRLGEPLLHRNIGGKSGGGSQLTDFAIRLMERFRKLHHLLSEDSDALFEEVMTSTLSRKKLKKSS